jgi:hypothetical protein
MTRNPGANRRHRHGNRFLTGRCDELRMRFRLRNTVALLLKASLAAFVANEVRGLVLAGPVLYGLYEAGGTAMAIWLAFCSLAGIAISVLVPLFLARKFRLV